MNAASKPITKSVGGPLLSLGIALLGACTAAPPPNPVAVLDAQTVTSQRMQRFENSEEFERYRDRVKTLGKKHNVWWSGMPLPAANESLLAQIAQSEQCDPAIENCAATTRELQDVVVTGSKVSKPATSITNNQDAEVDEGDIVKLVGKHLVVLQDARLFSVATQGPLRLIDRIDLYEPKEEAWYDELLVFGNKLIVTGYSYKKEASEINVLSINDEGVFKLEARYLIESNDYFSGNNYASRLVRGQLLLYTPVDMTDVRSRESLRIPRIRKWTQTSGFGEWQPLFKITDIYKPIQRTLTPQLHVITTCPISLGATFSCKSRGIVAPQGREMYVSAENAYLWIGSDESEWGYDSRYWNDCPAGVSTLNYPATASAAYRFPIESNDVLAVHTQGAPYDQFAFEERDGKLHALLGRLPRGCYLQANLPMQFTAIPLRRFTATPGYIPSTDYIRLPDVPRVNVQSRYTDSHVIYGSAEGVWEAHWHGKEAYTPGKLVAVPLSDPTQPIALSLSHSAERVESFGNNAVVFGYLPNFKMAVSTVSLRYRPRIADTENLGDLVESEGRSHAFNYIVSDDGSGVLGLPTVVSKRGQRWQYGFGAEPSDVQFFAADKSLAITPLGFLGAIPDGDEAYECEVSCVDWYGNARPIFIDGRAYALTGTELIEGAVRGNTIVEMRRVRITSTPMHVR